MLYFADFFVLEKMCLCLQAYFTSSFKKMQHLYLNFLMNFKILKKYNIRLYCNEGDFSILTVRHFGRNLSIAYYIL